MLNTNYFYTNIIIFHSIPKFSSTKTLMALYPWVSNPITACQSCISVTVNPITVTEFILPLKCILWSFFRISVFLFYFHLLVFSVDRDSMLFISLPLVCL